MFNALADSSEQTSSDDDAAQPSTPNAEPTQKQHSIYGDVDPDDLQITIDTLKQVANDLTLFRSLPFKTLRMAIGPLAHALGGGAAGSSNGGASGGAGRRRKDDRRAGGTRLDGLSPEERLRQMDRDALNHRVLRAERLARLEQLALDEGGGEGGRALLLGGPSTDVSRMGTRAPTNEDSIAALLPDGPAAVEGGADLSEVQPATLHYARSCYVCKGAYRELHAFYASLCPACAELNWRKRDERCDLRGRVALVTGGRMKIGFRIVLKLLRCGASVIATTRFPLDAARRFSSQLDAAEWTHRLQIVGADFRDLHALETFCDTLPTLVPRLDIIINNACQTVRRPPQYYLSLISAEASRQDDAPAVGQLTDAHRVVAKALDLRTANSWTLKLEDVSTAEMAEVLAINALAPAIINGRLRAFMERSDKPRPLKFIVNVSAMEGRFYKWKAPTHPHTNMAKAALNMMTRTSAADFAKSNIYITAVDTGWINDEKPAERAAADASTHNFQTPIDEIDAAARVLDPIIAPLRRLEAGEPPEPPFGVFLKDYEKCEW